VFLCALGIGSVVESMEFMGYLKWGEGEGFFQFGSGDYEGLKGSDNMLTIIGGGYFDAMEDLIVNSLGALSGVLLIGIEFFLFKKDRV